MYVEVRCVDNKGRLDRRHMRCNQDRHPGLLHDHTLPGDKKYPTILKLGVKVKAHDDWDCLDDLEAAGLLKIHGTGIQPWVALTPKGWLVASKLRRFRAGGGRCADFEGEGTT